MKMLVTGGAGFVGSNLSVMFKERHPDAHVIVLDNLKRRGSEMNINRLRDKGIEFIHGDIRNPEDLNLKGIDVLLECSAEPSVLAGFGESPLPLIQTNLIGTVNCLEMARKNRSSVIFLSSSRVYPYDKLNEIEYEERETRLEWKEGQDIKGWSKKGIAVDFPLDGIRSMYGATKLASELLMQEYIDMYDIKGVINRCGVLSGPWQFAKIDQGVFSQWVMAHYFKKPLNYIGYGGTGKQVRDLLHIEDLFRLLEIQLSRIDEISGRAYNVGGGRDVSLSLMETTRLCEEISGNQIKIGTEKDNRPADMPIYITDNSTVTKELGWKSEKTARNILQDIHEWVDAHAKDIKECLF